MYITICEIEDQSKFEAGNRAPKDNALEQPRGMGDTCTPVADSCQCMAKTTTIL